MSNEEITALCNDIYRGFWIKWRGKVYPRQAPEWKEIHQEAKALMDKYDNCPLVEHNIQELIGILEDRARECEGVWPVR